TRWVMRPNWARMVSRDSDWVGMPKASPRASPHRVPPARSARVSTTFLRLEVPTDTGMNIQIRLRRVGLQPASARRVARCDGSGTGRLEQYSEQETLTPGGTANPCPQW